MREPPKPRLTTMGALLNCCSKLSQRRIDELPTNSTPPGAGIRSLSALAKASKLDVQRGSMAA
jgi:hypothetical protein